MPFVRSLLQNLIRSYTISLSGVVVMVVEVTINTISLSNIVDLILLIKVIVMFNFISFYVSKRPVCWHPFVRR